VYPAAEAGLDSLAQRKGGNLRRAHGVAIAGQRPVSGEQFNLAVHQRLFNCASGFMLLNAMQRRNGSR